jgi:hypothetical protein
LADFQSVCCPQGSPAAGIERKVVSKSAQFCNGEAVAKGVFQKQLFRFWIIGAIIVEIGKDLPALPVGACCRNGNVPPSSSVMVKTSPLSVAL